MRNKFCNARGLMAFALVIILAFGFNTNMTFAAATVPAEKPGETLDVYDELKASILAAYAGVLELDGEAVGYAYFAMTEDENAVLIISDDMEFKSAVIYIGRYESTGDETIEITDAATGESIEIILKGEQDSPYIEVKEAGGEFEEIDAAEVIETLRALGWVETDVLAELEAALIAVFSGEMDNGEGETSLTYIAFTEDEAMLVFVDEEINEIAIISGAFEDDGEGTISITSYETEDIYTLIYEETDGGMYYELLEMESSGDFLEIEMGEFIDLLRAAGWGQTNRYAELLDAIIAAYTGEVEDEDGVTGVACFGLTEDEAVLIVHVAEEDGYIVILGTYTDDGEETIEIEIAETETTVTVLYEMLEGGIYIEIEGIGMCGELEETDAEVIVDALSDVELMLIGINIDDYEGIGEDSSSAAKTKNSAKTGYGTIKWCDTVNGYGFITDDEGNDVYFNTQELKSMVYRQGSLSGKRVSFTLHYDTITDLYYATNVLILK